MATKKKGVNKRIPEGAVPVKDKIRLTKWTASNPVTKELSLDNNGQLKKNSTANQLYDGTITHLECGSTEFIDILRNIGTNDCLSYGIPVDKQVTKVMSRSRFAKNGEPDDAVTRTADKMIWPDGPAILMVDYDPHGTMVHTRNSLLDAIYHCCPTIKSISHIYAVSASSCLFDANSGQQVTGVAGQRIYIIVADGTDIPRASEVLFKRSWLNGHGHIKISTAGSMLVRSIIDAAVFQPNRIDYCAPPICNSPLESHKPAPDFLGNPMLILDTRVALSLSHLKLVTRPYVKFSFCILQPSM